MQEPRLDCLHVGRDVSSGLAPLFQVGDKVHQKVMQEFLILFTPVDELSRSCVSGHAYGAEPSELNIGCHFGTSRDVVLPSPDLLIFFEEVSVLSSREEKNISFVCCDVAVSIHTSLFRPCF